MGIASELTVCSLEDFILRIQEQKSKRRATLYLFTRLELSYCPLFWTPGCPLPVVKVGNETQPGYNSPMHMFLGHGRKYYNAINFREKLSRHV